MRHIPHFANGEDLRRLYEHTRQMRTLKRRTAAMYTTAYADLFPLKLGLKNVVERCTLWWKHYFPDRTSLHDILSNQFKIYFTARPTQSHT